MPSQGWKEGVSPSTRRLTPRDKASTIGLTPQKKVTQMSVIHLSTQEDMQWLNDVHYEGASEYKVAILYGNEDSPDKIELFSEDRFDCKPVVLVPDDNGDMQLETDRYCEECGEELDKDCQGELRCPNCDGPCPHH